MEERNPFSYGVRNEQSRQMRQLSEQQRQHESEAGDGDRSLALRVVASN